MADAAEIYHLLEKLCASIAGEKRKHEMFKAVGPYIANCSIMLQPFSTDGVTSRIWKKLLQQTPTDASKFLEIHELAVSSTSNDIAQFHRVLALLDILSAQENSWNRSQGGASKTANMTNTIVSLKSKLESTFDTLQKLTLDAHSTPISCHSVASSKTAPSFSSDANLDMIQECIYALVGVQGKYLQKNVITGEFKINVKQKGISKYQAVMMLRISKVGYFHDFVKKYTNPKSGCHFRGLMGQGMVFALEKELSNYCGLVALLQEQLNKQKEGHEGSDPLTLMKLSCWVAEPLNRLMWLSRIAAACGSDTKGGKFLSVVFKYLPNGDFSVRNMIRDLLRYMCKPFQHMLVRWLLDGEIEDPFDEFFIEELPDVELDRLWHEKYRIQKNRLPDFIKDDVANKIFVTGKSINFLRAVCLNTQPYKNSEELKACFENNVEALFSPTNDTKLHMMIDRAYLDTSKNVLDVIFGQHRLIENLQALKNYLLLGQGDFIGLLMQNLKHELDRPAKELLRHELHSIMCAALRSSCAQFDDQEILDNLDVQLLAPFDGDLGWDTFTLHYSVQGPLATMLRPYMDEYRLVFKPLWNIKRIEFIVLKIWKEQIFVSKCLRRVEPQIKAIKSRLHLVTSEMIHFVHQIQYYTMFEVIECSWTELLEKIRGANTLDDVLVSHERFLEKLKDGIFINQSTSSLSVAMEAIFNAIMKLENWQDSMFGMCLEEEKARASLETQIKQSEKKGTFGLTSGQRLEYDEARKVFEGKLFQQQKTLESIASDFTRYIREFIYKLTASQEVDLQLFGIRLDFNEYYKNRDVTLNAPLTFEHMRQSSIFYSRPFYHH